MSNTSSEFSLDVTLGGASFSAAGGTEDVLRAFSEFQELLTRRKESPADDDEEAGDEVADPAGGGATADSVGKGEANGLTMVPLRVFLDSKKLPRGNAIIGLGIAIWAKRYDAVAGIDADIAKAYWRDSGRKIPANISRDLGSAASEGWLERLPTRGLFSATSYGEKHFDSLEAS